MSLYQCKTCGCIENTACTGKGYFNEPADCSACGPTSISQFTVKVSRRDGHWKESDGSWHGLFPRMYLPKGEYETDQNTGDLVHKVTKKYDPSLERDTPYEEVETREGVHKQPDVAKRSKDR